MVTPPRTSNRRSAERIRSLVKEHHAWRRLCVNILAAENVSSPRVRELVGSDLMHRYSEYEAHDMERRFDEGGRYVVQVERIAQEAAKRLFGCTHAELRPVSGHVAISACILALASPGSRTLEVKGGNGGHEWYYLAKNNPPMNYTPDWLPFDTREWNVDTDQAKRKIARVRPSLVILGSSFYLFPHPTRELADAAAGVGAQVVYDGAHVMGLIAGGSWPNPLKLGAGLLTGSTHKSFPGPQKGVILGNDGALMLKVRNSIYPSLLTNHHLMNVAALGYSMLEFLDFGEAYAAQVVENARAFAESLSGKGFDVVGEKNGFTRSHQVLVRTGGGGAGVMMPGAEAAKLLDRANIVCNKMELEDANGLRLGTSEVTRVGMKRSEMEELAELMADVLIRRRDPSRVAGRVRAFMKGYTKVGYSYEEGRDPYAYISAPARG